MDTPESTRIHELEARVVELTSVVERLAATNPSTTGSVDGSTTASTTAPDGHPAAIEGPTTSSSRRSLLRLAGAAALGAAGASAVAARPAAADNGIDLLGAANATADVTRVIYNGASATTSAFVFGSGIWLSNSSFHPATLAGWSDGSANRPINGVYGYTTAPAGTGVIGRNNSGNATGDGVYGYAPASNGVHGEGETGVLAEGDTIGVSATASGATSYGVFAISGNSGVAGLTGTGYAMSALVSGKANMYLQPNNSFFGTSLKTPVNQRTDEHKAGELESIDGELWFCVATGTPGTWRKLTGPTVAGGFHAITPTRVYDSRSAAPAQGALGAGGDKTISVKDGRDLATGNVVAADLVPAGAMAVTANVTVVNTALAGFLSINPGGNTTVTAATVNWYTSGQILNNGVNLTLNANREVTVVCGGDTAAQTDFVVDITGYFL